MPRNPEYDAPGLPGRPVNLPRAPRRSPRLIRRYDGSVWRLSDPVRTSDGFVVMTGHLVDPQTGRDMFDDNGVPVVHSFLVGGGA